MSDTTPDRNEPVYASPPARAGGGGLLGGLALLLSLLALGAAGYLFYTTQVTQKIAASGVANQVDNVKERFTTIKDDVAGIETKVEKVGSDLTEFKSEVADGFGKIRSEELATIQQTQAEGAKKFGELESNVANLSGSVDKVYDELDKSLGEWELQEVEQILLTANNRLQLNGDVKVAATALRIAGERVAAMDDPGLTDVRTALASESAELDAIETVDVTGLAARIRALHDGVDALPLLETPRLMGSPEEEAQAEQNAEQPGANDDKPESAEEGGIKGWMQSSKWKSIGNEVAKDLGTMVKVQRASEARAPLMSPDQRFFLFQNLKLMLNSSQVALLKSDEAGFQGNLQSAGKWIGEYFVQDAKPVKSTLAEINELAGVSIAQELPDISGSLSSLRKVIEKRAAK